jgi:hypothetical protein
MYNQPIGLLVIKYGIDMGGEHTIGPIRCQSLRVHAKLLETITCITNVGFLVIVRNIDDIWSKLVVEVGVGIVAGFLQNKSTFMSPTNDSDFVAHPHNIQRVAEYTVAQ